jgi:uncharacterized membrane protein
MFFFFVKLILSTQVRQQSKVIASQVIARTRHLREKEVCLLRQKKEQQLKEWKHQRLTELKEELNYGLEHIGSSFKAVDQEVYIRFIPTPQEE